MTREHDERNMTRKPLRERHDERNHYERYMTREPKRERHYERKVITITRET